MQRSAHGDAVHVGQAEIEDDKIDHRLSTGPLDSGESGCHPFGEVPVDLERTDEALRDAVIVFDDQDPLGRMLVSHTGEGTAITSSRHRCESNPLRVRTDFTVR